MKDVSLLPAKGAKESLSHEEFGRTCWLVDGKEWLEDPLPAFGDTRDWTL